jgi:hypothetical protein
VKRFLILLIVAAGGVAWASLAVPTNAAVVNGQTITQTQLSSDVAAIAGSTPYFCFLNAQALEEGAPQPGLPSVQGAGQASEGGALTTSTANFMVGYLNTIVGHQLVYQLAARYHAQPSASDLATARTGLINQITDVQHATAAGQLTQPAKCTAASSATGAEVLKALPSSFVNEQVRFNATLALLEEDVSGIGSTTPDLQKYFDAHRTNFDTVCYTLAGYQTEAEAQSARASVYEGAAFATLAKTSGGGPEGCEIRFGLASELPTAANFQTLPLNTVSAPISYNGGYLLIELTSATPVPFSVAKLAVQQAVEDAGVTTFSSLNSATARKANVTVNPRYGSWSKTNAQLALPPEPAGINVLNAAANLPTTASTTTAATTPISGQSG